MYNVLEKWKGLGEGVIMKYEGASEYVSLI